MDFWIFSPKLLVPCLAPSTHAPSHYGHSMMTCWFKKRKSSFVNLQMQSLYIKIMEMDIMTSLVHGREEFPLKTLDKTANE